MKVTKIISLKKSGKVLEEVANLVKVARKVYGNGDAEITVPSVNTVNGCTNIKYLSTNDKAAVAKKELQSILAEINSADAEVEGLSADYELIGAVATNAVLVNLSASLNSKLI